MFIAIAIAPADFDASRRSSNGFSGVNAMPMFGAFVKPLIDRPGNAGTDSTPGVFSAMSVMRLITSVVRSKVDASGSCAKPTRYCLSCAGTKPVGVWAKPNAVSAIRPA